MIETVRVKVDGVWTELRHNAESGLYEGTLTAPSVISYYNTGGYYPVTVEAVNDRGFIATKDDADAMLGDVLRLIVLPEFIFDRTQEDVDNRARKALIKPDDLNRIDKNTALVGGLVATTVSVKTDWQMGGLPRASDYERIRQNTAKIREAYGTYRDTPQVPERPYTHYAKWNAIERILHDVFYLYARNIKSKIYCGEIACGEEIGVI